MFLSLAFLSTTLYVLPTQTDESVRIDFAGGTVTQYVEVVRQAFTAHSVSPNIVLNSGGDQFMLPPIRMRDVDLHTALDLLAHTARMQTPEPGQIQVVNLGDAFVINPLTRAQRPASPRVSRVFSLVAALTDRTPEDVLTAVELALSLLEDGYDEPMLRFHEATSLLVARGHVDQINQIEHVISQLVLATDQAQRKHTEVMKRHAAQIQQLEAQLADAELRAREANHHASMLESRVMGMEAELVRAQRRLAAQDQELADLRSRSNP